MYRNESFTNGCHDIPEVGNHDSEISQEPYYDERLCNGVKVVIMGPPHSGKSVFIDALSREVDPQFGVTMLSGCPDGEGLWLQRHYDDPEVAALRRKGEFSPEFVEHATESVRNFSGPLAFIDIGGRVSDENRQIAAGATHAIILAGNLQKATEWQAFADELNIPVVAKLHSNYSGRGDVIHTATNEKVVASAHYLERGTSSIERQSVRAAARLVEALANNNVAYWQGVAERELNGESVEVAKENLLRAFGRDNQLSSEDIKGLSALFAEKVEGKKVRLTGFDKGREMVALCFAALDAGAVSVEDNSMRTGPVDVVRIEQGDDTDEELDYVVERMTDGSVFVDVRLDDVIKPVVMQNMRMPAISGERVVISGRIPHWLWASMAVSYAETNKSIAIFTPGEGNMTVWSRNKEEIGEVRSGK